MRYFFILIAALFLAGCACSKTATTSQSIASEKKDSLDVSDKEEKILELRKQAYALMSGSDQTKKDPSAAYQKFKELADLGDPVAWDIIGSFHHVGYAGVEKSCKKAIEAYTNGSFYGYPVAINNLAYTLTTCDDKKLRDPERAKKLIKNLFIQTPFFLALLDTYAAALAENKEKKRAIHTQQTVLEIAKLIEMNPDQIKIFEKNLQDYKQGKTPKATYPTEDELSTPPSTN